MKVWSIACAAVLGFVLMSEGANAHAVWIAERHGVEAVVYGHGPSDDAYDPAKVISLAAKGVDGADVELKLEKRKDHVTFEHDDAVATVAVTFDNGFWSMDADKKWHNKPKDEVPNAKQGGHYLKYGVSYMKSIEGDIKPQGLKFEIVPLKDPLKTDMGDELPIQVLFDGKPAVDVDVIADYVSASEVVTTKTDKEGKATITVRNQGLNIVASAYSEDMEGNSKADKTGYMASLGFTLKSGH